jgi:hypothetical protein
MRSDTTGARPDHRRTEWHGCTETAISNFADYSPFHMSQNRIRSARAGVTVPRENPAPEAARPGVDLIATRRSSFSNHAMTPEGTNPIYAECRPKTSVVPKLTTVAVGRVASIGDHQAARLRSHRLCWS